ncbi:ROK family protein [Microbacterium sp. KR10-403]|uniref:ROK family protein n=1 Tax=Microbacterium sp. KR10-403 TaxID=3158581 RepID=UPI0032E456CB
MIVGVETGGTKVVCASAYEQAPTRLVDAVTIPTADPVSTIGAIRRAVDRLGGPTGAAALGVAAFGPLDVDPASPRYGYVTSTPKPGWSQTDLLGPLRAGREAPTALTTDVNAAAIAEHHARGAAAPANLAYLTVGTGIGSGVLVDGHVVGGTGFPEVAHLRVVRHPDDDFAGVCPFHGDCLEGLASGPAIARRWGSDASHLPGARRAAAVDIEAFYLAQVAETLRYLVGTDLLVLGGGVAKTPGLLAAVTARIGGDGAAAGSGRASLRVEKAVLGDHAGVTGALLLAAGRLEGAWAVG